jgi:hypothetical protein
MDPGVGVGVLLVKEKPMAKSKGPERMRGRESANEDLRVPSQPGKPPRPATEPPGSEWSTKTHKTATDPATGEPNKPPVAGPGSS